MVPTYGLTHLALAVSDVERSSRFYRDVFGSGLGGGIAHFGFRLKTPEDIGRAREAVEAAGGTVREQGEFVPGEPYLFALDPDGYEFEIWYERPTPVDGS